MKTAHSPARSVEIETTLKAIRPRRSRSAGSAHSSSAIGQSARQSGSSFVLSFRSPKSFLTDNTCITAPKSNSWWKKLGEDTVQNIVSQDNPAKGMDDILNDFERDEPLSQENKNYDLGLPDISTNETLGNIAIAQKRLFHSKANPLHSKFKNVIEKDDTACKQDITLPKTDKPQAFALPVRAQKSKPIFPAALLNMSSTSTNKTQELPDLEHNVRPKKLLTNIVTVKKNAFTNQKLVESEDESLALARQVKTKKMFGNHMTNKRNTRFSGIIAMESDEDIPNIQPKVFGFQKPGKRRRSSLIQGEALSSSLSMMSDIEFNNWNMLPSSTMVEDNFSEKSTPAKKSRFTRESDEKNSIESKEIKQETKNAPEFSNAENRDNNQKINKITECPSFTRNTQINTFGTRNTLKESEENNQSDENNDVNVNPINKPTLETEQLYQCTKDSAKMANNQNLISESKTSSEIQILDNSMRRENSGVENESVPSSDKEINNCSVKNDEIVLTKQNDQTGNHVVDHTKIGNQNATSNEDKTENHNTNVNAVNNYEQMRELQEKNTDIEMMEDNFRASKTEANDNLNNLKLNTTQNLDHTKIENQNATSNEDKTENNNTNMNAVNNYEQMRELQEKNIDIEMMEDNFRASKTEANDNLNNLKVNTTQDRIENAINDTHKLVDCETEIEENANFIKNSLSKIASQTNLEEKIDSEDKSMSELKSVLQDEQSEEESEKEECDKEETSNEKEISEKEEFEKEEESENKSQSLANREASLSVKRNIDSLKDMNCDGINNEMVAAKDNTVEEEIKNTDSEDCERSRSKEESNHNILVEQTPENTIEISNTDKTNEYNALKMRSPEAVLSTFAHNYSQKTSLIHSSVRTTNFIERVTLRPSFASMRDSLDLPNDGSKNSTEEGSGWDSHRTTRKTLRQTFGKDFTFRKSLRTLVLEKSSKPHTNGDNILVGEIIPDITKSHEDLIAHSETFDQHKSFMSKTSLAEKSSHIVKLSLGNDPIESNEIGHKENKALEKINMFVGNELTKQTEKSKSFLDDLAKSNSSEGDVIKIVTESNQKDKLSGEKETNSKNEDTKVSKSALEGELANESYVTEQKNASIDSADKNDKSQSAKDNKHDVSESANKNESKIIESAEINESNRNKSFEVHEGDINESVDKNKSDINKFVEANRDTINESARQNQKAVNKSNDKNKCKINDSAKVNESDVNESAKVNESDMSESAEENENDINEYVEANESDIIESARENGDNICESAGENDDDVNESDEKNESDVNESSEINESDINESAEENENDINEYVETNESDISESAGENGDNKSESAGENGDNKSESARENEDGVNVSDEKNESEVNDFSEANESDMNESAEENDNDVNEFIEGNESDINKSVEANGDNISESAEENEDNVNESADKNELSKQNDSTVNGISKKNESTLENDMETDTDEGDSADEKSIEDSNEENNSTRENETTEDKSAFEETEENDVTKLAETANEHQITDDESADNNETLEENESSDENLQRRERNEYELNATNKSTKRKQAQLMFKLQMLKKKNEERINLIKERVMNDLKAPRLSIDYNSYKSKQSKQVKPLPKPVKTVNRRALPFGPLPKELLEDLKYKPPKPFKPRNAPWINKRLYKFLEAKLEPTYDFRAHYRAEKLATYIYKFTQEFRRDTVYPNEAINQLKQEMARLNIVNTHFEFYNFCREYMPTEIRTKIIPDIINKLPLPRAGIFTEILINRQ